MAYIGRQLSAGNYLKLDNISSQFNGTTTTFTLTTGGQNFFPGSPYALLLSLGGVVQEPNSSFELNGSQITFASAPLTGTKFFCTALSQALGIGVPGDGTVTATKLAGSINYTGALTISGTLQNANGNIYEDLYELDDISSSTSVGSPNNTYSLTFNQEPVAITNPFKLLVTVNGVIQSAYVYNSEYVHLTTLLCSNDGYTIDSDNNIKFTEELPRNSQVVMKTVSGANKSTTRKYPFKALDIIF